MLDSKPLIRWFLQEQRDLPWRRERSPYAVWVSEMMLQQTQVAVVIPYFERWMKRFPSIKHLAEASLDEVLKVWEGLGYYSRARYLHQGAKHILEHHNGIFPNSPEDLSKIKGLGPYTSGAIRSFAFQHRVPAVDGNVVRVLTRFFMIKEDISKPAAMRKVWEFAEKILPEKDSWVVNEALIELGAIVCKKQPQCQECPLKQNCQGYSHGIASELPFKSAKTKYESLFRAVPVIQWKSKFLVKRGEKGEIMSDLYEFPYFETDVTGITADQLQFKVQDWLGSKLEHGKELNEVAHSFTRFRVLLRPVFFTCVSNSKPKVEAPYTWLEILELKKLAFSSGHRRILNLF
jgi:A/G-specific adenine glycosylase